MPRIIFSILCLLMLSGCVTRDQADENMRKGCEAGVRAFLQDGFEVQAIQKTSFKDSPIGHGYRLVKLSVLESDGWANLDKGYSCVFREDFTFGRFTHTAVIYQLKTPDKTYGQDGYQILGTLEEQTKLVQAVEKAMNR